MFGGSLDLVAQLEDNLALGGRVSFVSSLVYFFPLGRWRGCHVIPMLPHQKVYAIKCIEDK